MPTSTPEDIITYNDYIGGGFNEILTMTEGTDTKYMLTEALGSVTAVYVAVIAGLKVGGCSGFIVIYVIGQSEK